MFAYLKSTIEFLSTSELLILSKIVSLPSSVLSSIDIIEDNRSITQVKTRRSCYTKMYQSSNHHISINPFGMKRDTDIDDDCKMLVRSNINGCNVLFECSMIIEASDDKKEILFNDWRRDDLAPYRVMLLHRVDHHDKRLDGLYSGSVKNGLMFSWIHFLLIDNHILQVIINREQIDIRSGLQLYHDYGDTDEEKMQYLIEEVREAIRSKRLIL